MWSKKTQKKKRNNGNTFQNVYFLPNLSCKVCSLRILIFFLFFSFAFFWGVAILSSAQEWFLVYAPSFIPDSAQEIIWYAEIALAACKAIALPSVVLPWPLHDINCQKSNICAPVIYKSLHFRECDSLKVFGKISIISIRWNWNKKVFTR